MTPVNLSTKTSAQSETKLVNDTSSSQPSVLIKSSNEVDDPQKPIVVTSPKPLQLEKEKETIVSNSSCSKTVDDTSRSIFGNKNDAKPASSTFTILPNFNSLPSGVLEKAAQHTNDVEPKSTTPKTLVTDAMPKPPISTSIVVDKKCDDDTEVSNEHDSICADSLMFNQQ
jgi:hypothetical protein